MALRESIRLDPTFNYPWNNLGRVLMAEENWDEAATAFQTAICIDPRDAVAHNNLGVVLEERDDLTGAEAAYRAAVRADPVYAQAHQNLGDVLKAAGDFRGAVDSWREAVRLDPKNERRASWLAWFLATGPNGHRNGAQAVELASRVCERTDWREPNYIDTLAAAWAEAGDFPKAVEYQTRALRFPAFENSEGARHRLDLYRRQQPFRVPARVVAPPPREVAR